MKGVVEHTDHTGGPLIRRSPHAEAARNFYQAVFGWQYDIGGPEFGGYTTAHLGDKAVAMVVKQGGKQMGPSMIHPLVTWLP